jgi:hypothetical protein
MAQQHAFEAFKPSVVVDDFARKIDALCVWGATILASLSDGSLLFFEQVPDPPQAHHPPGPARQPPSANPTAAAAAASASASAAAPALTSWQVTRVHKGFTTRGGARRLQALAGQPYLLTLSGECVGVHV